MNKEKHIEDILQACTTLKEGLGRRLSSKEVAAFLGLDEDTVRKYYREIGGIRPTGPKGRILFFEQNIKRALLWREEHAFEHNEAWTNSVERAGSEERSNQTETVQNQKGGTGVGGRGAEKGLVRDRHNLVGE